ncbi:MAG: methyl-accepting chemotaxis protein [Christensenellaceae bacterium]
MKNLSVSKKILFGFLIVILIIGVILAMTIITSITRNNDLERAGRMNELQQEANTLLYNFNLARVEIRTVFTSVDAEEEYNLALEYLDTCIGILDHMDEMSAELGGYMTEENAEIRRLFEAVRAGVINVGDNDEKVNLAIADMKSSGQVMTDGSDDLYDLVTNITMEIAATDSAAGIERVTSVMMPVKELSDIVNNIRVNSRVLMFQQDLSIIPDIMAELDSAEQQANSVRTVLTTEEGRAAIDELVGALAGFRSAVNDVSTHVTNSDAEIASARAVFLELSDMITAGVIAIADDVSTVNAQAVSTSQFVMYIMIGIGAAAVVFAVVIAMAIGKIITRPLNKMKDVMLQAGETGNLNFSEEVRKDVKKESEAKDEIGQSLMAFTTFIDHITNMAGTLESVANKDLTVDVNLLSDEDTMGISLKKMIGNLNHMFTEINNIAAQVAAAAGDVAMGAQGLAQGSTEQAATVQEISASVNAINEQMSTSSETANEAAQGSMEISDAAQEGNRKMTQMMSSMHEINDASQAIRQVIKVIDDIAFQTNILALNAAVEAARAGDHGKGFAVVADEVRNLAGKSADAAKETSDLISKNIEKTEQGLSYTEETATSLTQIVEGIQKNSESLQVVAQQSEGAKSATSQVNLAVDQVAQVVQQNSATSEQSAAASEEMSNQAQILQQLISEFKIRDQGIGTGMDARPFPSSGSAEDGMSGDGDQADEDPYFF